ncbi:hypothetical protein ACKXGF_03645 [Alkalibacillus sp. S2W]|uniref:hypothetical protein n=1 Tax=Alkalibacillus sp. S2W TaxID=3386553 RepID=UPI00398CE072
MLKTILKQRDGVSLVEVLGALVILSLILIGFFSMFTQTSSMQNVTEEEVQASNLINIVREDVKQLTFSSNDTGYYESFDSLDLTSVENNGQIVANNDFFATIEIKEETETNNLLKVTINLLNEDDRRVAHTYTYVEVTNNE